MPKETWSGELFAAFLPALYMHVMSTRFLRCVRLSPLLSLSDDESQLRLREDAMFVYGGNVADKGSGIIMSLHLRALLMPKYTLTFNRRHTNRADASAAQA
jgi:hypothetical protein